MPLILRIDVDKPYGRQNVKQKILSKLREDFWFPPIPILGYLHDLENLLHFLAEYEIQAHLYFRMCTLPPKGWFDGQYLNGHKLGLHAEDTRSLATFKKELEKIQKHFTPRKISSFTKHGSGKWKGGRNHYPYYEPDKYLAWGNAVCVPFLFGNDEKFDRICKSYGAYQHYPGAFWIDRPYASYERDVLQEIIDDAKTRNIVVIMHNGWFEANRGAEEAMRNLIIMAKEDNVDWITI